MRNPISEFHPLAVFLYFMTAVGITLLWNRPGLLLASFLIAFGYACALEKGKKADIVVFDGNLFETAIEEIRSRKVEVTFLNGRIVYSHE